MFPVFSFGVARDADLLKSVTRVSQLKDLGKLISAALYFLFENFGFLWFDVSP